MSDTTVELRSRGFTLIELMIAMAIVAILTAIAYPSFQDSLRKGYRAECRSGLVTAMQQQERFYAANSTYTATLSAVYKTYSGDKSTSSACTMAAAACSGSTIASCVTITASTQKGDPTCATLTLDSTNTRGAADSASADTVTKCWP